MSVATPPRRLLLLTVLAGCLGVCGGGAAWVLLHLIGLITNLALFHRWGWSTPSFGDLVLGPQLYLAAIGGALVVSCIARFAPIIRGHGIPEAMEAVLTKESRIAPRTAIAKPISAAVAIGTGAPFGAEGPIIVTGGAIGSLLGQIIRVSPSERKILLASGAAAGMSATFGAPLASVVLAIELLLFELSPRAFVPLVAAASVAGAMHSLLFGAGPLFHVPPHDYAGLTAIPAFVLLGLGCGLLAVLMTTVLFRLEELYRRLPVSDFWHPMIGAAIFVSVGMVAPRALGVGYDAIGDVLAGRLALATVAALATVKLVAWWFALSSGTSGGTLAPILLISAGFGTVAGSFLNHIMPGSDIALGAFAVVAMAATFGAATRATFASMVFVFELTRDYEVVVPLMLATVVADLVATSLSDDSIMTEKLTRRGLRIGRQYAIDPFATTHVRSIMSAPAVSADVTVSVTSDDLAIDVLHLMVRTSADRVAVVDGEDVVGAVTMSDLLKVRERQLEHETHQAGRLLRRRVSGD